MPVDQIKDILNQLPFNIDVDPYIAMNLFQPVMEKVQTIDNSIR
jgi:hypothetical protein